jgi:hypothetical protein
MLDLQPSWEFGTLYKAFALSGCTLGLLVRKLVTLPDSLQVMLPGRAGASARNQTHSQMTRQGNLITFSIYPCMSSASS